MEELLPSAPFLSPFFRCYLSSPLMYAHCTFSGEKKYQSAEDPIILTICTRQCRQTPQPLQTKIKSDTMATDSRITALIWRISVDENIGYSVLSHAPRCFGAVEGTVSTYNG